MSHRLPTLGAMGRRRQFGSVRRLASGRWQASYWWEGTRHLAPRTFNLRGGATRWLSGVEADLANTAELMARMGHASAAAALRYQHATADRDRAIAASLSSLGEQALASVTDLVPAERQTN